MTSATTRSQPDYSRFTQHMRERFLTRPPAEWGIEPAAENPQVYGVLMEWLSEGVTLTVAAFCEGSASVYTSLGHGMIGGHADEQVNSDARALVEAAARVHDDASPTSEFPYPGPGRVQFYLLTFTGVRVVDEALEAIFDGRSRYVDMYDHGWAVFERFTVVTDPTRRGGIAGGHQREWAGAEGYVSCLLTAMSRGMGRSMVISASEPVPDLAALAEGNDDLREWLEAQAFPYETMDAREVIRVLRRVAGIIIRLPFVTRRAELPAIHAGEDGGPVACVYDIEIAPFDRSATIVMAPRHDRRVAALQRQADAQSIQPAAR